MNWFGGDLDRFHALFPLNDFDPRNHTKAHKTLQLRVISWIALLSGNLSLSTALLGSLL